MSDARFMKLRIDDNKQLYLNDVKISGVIDAGIKTEGYKQLTDGEAILSLQIIVNVEAIKGRTAT